MSEPLGLTGPRPATADEKTCWDCSGSGKVWFEVHLEAEAEPCQTCNGRGSITKRWHE